MIKALLEHIKASCTQIQWYKNLESVPRKAHFFAFFLAMFFCGVLFSIRFAFYDLQTLKTNITTVAKDIERQYPENLSVTWNEGTLSISEQQLVLPLPAIFSKSDIYTAAPSILVTSESVTTEQVPELLKDYSYVIDSTQLHTFNGPEAGVYTVPLRDVVPFETITITKNTVNDKTDSILVGMMQVLNIGTLFLPFLAFLFLSFFRLIASLLDSALIYFLMKVNGFKTTFGYLYLVCLNILIPSELINQVTHFYPLEADSSMYSIVFWIYFLTIFVVHFAFFKNAQEKQVTTL